MIDENEDFGAFDFGNEILEVKQPEVKEETNSKEEDPDLDENLKDEEDDATIDTKSDIDQDPDNPEIKDKPGSVDEEESNESLDDDSIFKQYGEDVKPEVVRFFHIAKDYLLLDEEFKFDGKNIEEAYAQDAKFRNQAIAQNIIDKLPEKAKIILSEALELAKAGEDISESTFDKILTLSQDQIKYNFDLEDEEKNKENAKSYLTSIYKEKGLKDRVIKSMLEDLEDEDKLVAEAKEEKEAKDIILNKEKEKQVQEDLQAKQTQRDQAKVFKTTIEKTFDEIKYAPTKTSQLKDTIFTVEKETGQTKLIGILQKIYKHPKALIALADFATGFDEKTGEVKYEKSDSKKKTEEIKKIKSAIEEKITGAGFKNNTQRTKKTTDVDWEEIEI